MNILVTGGAGFIGSHLCERLSAVSSNTVFSLDRKMNSGGNVRCLLGETADIGEFNVTPDIIYHLGEYARVEQSLDDISAVIKSNVVGTAAVLEFARKTGAKLVYSASSTLFGDIGSASSPYAHTKAANVNMIKNYGTWFGLDYAIAYFYNVYGEGEQATGKYATLIAKFKALHENNEALPVVRPGTQRRTFTHVEDTVDGLLEVGEHGHGDGYGIASGDTYTVLEIAKLFGGGWYYLPERAGNRGGSAIVTEKTKALGWAPKRSLREYISGR